MYANYRRYLNTRVHLREDSAVDEWPQLSAIPCWANARGSRKRQEGNAQPLASLSRIPLRGMHHFAAPALPSLTALKGAGLHLAQRHHAE